MKEKKLIDIKNVGEFYNKLKEIVANAFNSWDECGLFDGLTEKQKRNIYLFGCCLLSRIYTPIQKRYTMQERKKYNKQIAFYENYLKKYKDENQQLKQLQKELAISELEKVKNYFCEEDEDGDGIKTGDWTITHDACEVAEFIDNQIKELKG